MVQHPLEKFLFCPRCGSNMFVENNMKSKRCESCGFIYYFNPSSSTVGVILNDRDELLVVRRAKEPARGTLDLPGGFCDCFETAEEGIVREVEEETGLHVDGEKFLFSLPNIYPYCGLDIHTIDLFFLCRVDDTSGVTAMDDAGEAIWLSWNEIKPEAFGLTSIRRGVEKLLRSGLDAVRRGEVLEEG